MDVSRKNNLQWLRLAFAVQVVVVHAAEHVGSYLPPYLAYFPGVPAFFFVSGFLIYATYQKTGGENYLRNRAWRLLPPLVFATLGGLAVVLIAKGGADLWRNGGTYVSWFLAQVTLGQAYNPAHFRDVGVGVINGSLWTLTTEILFYVAVPVIVAVERRYRHTVLALTAASFVIYALAPQLDRGTIFHAVSITPLIWGWMFGIGILAYKYYRLIPLRWLPLAIVPLIGMIAFGSGPLFQSSGNELGIVYFVCFAALILWLAFATPYVELKPDFSYAAYLWHMPIINLALVLGLSGAGSALGVFLAIAFVSVLSWYAIEAPSAGRRSSPSSGRPRAFAVRAVSREERLQH